MAPAPVIPDRIPAIRDCDADRDVSGILDDIVLPGDEWHLDVNPVGVLRNVDGDHSSIS